MYILNLEDNAIKHNAITKALRSTGRVEMDWARNLADGIEKIQTQIENGRPYDLIITDMWYPEEAGSGDAQSGLKLIQLIQEKSWNIPIILCSSMNYQMPDILGSVHYAENKDWEMALKILVKTIK